MLTIWRNKIYVDADMLTIKIGSPTGSGLGLKIGEIRMLNERKNEQQNNGALLLRLLVLVSSQGVGLSASEADSNKSESSF